ncbi:MAG: cation diffusion facilitator family transporter [Thermoprotei archaeon]
MGIYAIGSLIVLGFLGGLVKIVGGLLYGSRALFVDAMTSLANMVSLIVITYYYHRSREPPDRDHPYGHHRLGFIGVVITMIAYGYVAGIASVELVYSSEYTVLSESITYALAGLVIYGLAIGLALRIGGFYRVYGFFTISELYESIVSLAACIGGVLYSYVIDYIGAIGLTGYIFYELFETGRETLSILVDTGASPELVNRIREIFEENGYKVLRIRIRRVAHNIYHGDVNLEVPSGTDINRAYTNIEKLKKVIWNKYRIDLSVEITPSTK